MHLYQLTENAKQEILQQILKQADEQLSTIAANSEFNFKYKLDNLPLDKPITLNFESIAWLKMVSLLSKCSTEIGWHGLASINETRDTFNIHDILVYPQLVNGAHIEGDVAAYNEWFNALDDDTFNQIRMQGHSHVNMAPFASADDEHLFETLTGLIGPEDFYIFIIANKSLNLHIRIIDKAQNKVYIKYDKTNDINITISNIDLDQWYNANYDLYIRKYEAARNTTTSTTSTTNTSKSSTTNKPSYQKDDKKKFATPPWARQKIQY
jgi:hypothetical protein